ncbi:hypothetical protein D9M72_619030 [compost metagenome]
MPKAAAIMSSMLSEARIALRRSTFLVMPLPEFSTKTGQPKGCSMTGSEALDPFTRSKDSTGSEST